MQVVELADEFNLTTAEAADIAIAAGVRDAAGGTELTTAETDRWRKLAQARRDYQERTSPASTGSAASSGFGPLPAAPWEPNADGTPHPRAPAAPAMRSGASAPVGPDWDNDGGKAAELSPYAPAALALAVVSLIFPFVPAIAAFALAWYAKDRIERSGGRLSGDRLATAAQVVAGVGLLLWVGLLGASLYREARDEAAARDDGQVETGQIGWDEIGTGDCVRIPRTDELSVRDWTGLDCSEPHEAEVYSTELVAPTNQAVERYPGRNSLIPGATRLCQERFVDYVGLPYDQSSLRIAVYFPSATNWADEGDRTIGCIVFQDQYELIDGTLEQSLR